MRIAVPMAAGRLAMHFGHCESFAVLDTDVEAKTILNTDELDAPPHQPGLLPKWLADQGVEMVIAGGMGQRALQLFAQHGIQVVVGARSLPPKDIVEAYMAGTLSAGDNVCDH